MKQLYQVILTNEMYVMADSSNDARRLALYYRDSERPEAKIEIVDNETKISSDWMDALPYDMEDGSTVGEIVGRNVR